LCDIHSDYNHAKVFNLEELRERTVYVYANKIQRFFLMFSLRRFDSSQINPSYNLLLNESKRYFWELAVAGNNAIQGKKERRRASVENRVFHGDYIQYRENFELKALVNKNGSRDCPFFFFFEGNKQLMAIHLYKATKS